MVPRKNRFSRNLESEVITNNIIEVYKPYTVVEMQDALHEVFEPRHICIILITTLHNFD